MIYRLQKEMGDALSKSGKNKRKVQELIPEGFIH
jgi:hypothetical protein